MSEPYCTVHYREYLPEYTVYDRTGAVMIRTGSRAAAAQYLELAHRGISARVHYWLERWNYQIPRSIVNQLKTPLR